MSDESTGRAIKMALIKANKTRADLKEHTGKSRPTIDGWCNNGCKDMEDLRNIAEFCGMDLVALLELSERP